MNKWFVFVVIFTFAGGMSQTFAAGDAVAGKTASAICAGCHGADGNSVNPEWPKLAGQGAAYLVKQLSDFKAGKRKNATMAPMAAPLGDKDRADLAAYFSGQKRTPGSADRKLAELGQKIYRGGNPVSGVSACTGCHGPTGAGNPVAKFPAIGRQQAKYVENQLHAFASGERHNDSNRMMRNLAGKMTEKEIQAVASYVQALH